METVAASENCLHQHYRWVQTFRSISVGSILHQHIVEWLVASMRQVIHPHLQDPSITHLTSMVPAIDHTTIVIPEWMECESSVVVWCIYQAEMKTLTTNDAIFVLEHVASEGNRHVGGCVGKGRKPKSWEHWQFKVVALDMISIDCWFFTFLSLQNRSWGLSFLLLWGEIPSSTALFSNSI